MSDPVIVPSAKSSRPTFLWLAAVVVALAVGVGIGLLIGGSGSGDDTSSTSASDKSDKESVATTTKAARATTTKPQPPTPQDFLIDVTVVSKKCFGSAGCILQYTIKPTYIGAQDVDDDVELTVVYEIVGGDEQQVGSFTVKGGQATYNKQEQIEASESAVLTATVTKIIGY